MTLRTISLLLSLSRHYSTDYRKILDHALTTQHKASDLHFPINIGASKMGLQIDGAAQTVYAAPQFTAQIQRQVPRSKVVKSLDYVLLPPGREQN